MRILIQNETGEPDKMLRGIVKLVAKDRGLVDSMKVIFRYARKRSGMGGQAAIGLRTLNFNGSTGTSIEKSLGWYHRVTMKLSPDWKEDLIDFLQIFMHEIDHTLGCQHIDMKDWHTIEISDKLLTDVVVKIKEFYPIMKPSPVARVLEIQEKVYKEAVPENPA